MDITERLIKYISFDTQSADGQEEIPSTKKQFDLARLLADELREMGAQDVTVTDNCYVYAAIPSTSSRDAKTLGFISHMDTATDFPGGPVCPRIIKSYDGGAIVLNEKSGLSMSPGEFPQLSSYKGQDLIVTDGNTLLGADDKAGVAEIMEMARYFLENPSVPHGPIKIAFTPDEEVGRGADLFDVPGFGADAAYTVDGGALGEIEYENFNAASAKIQVNGANIHPGSAKGKMKNALLMAMELHGMLPPFENPMYTEGYEGFYHLNEMSGAVEQAHLSYIIRDHDKQKFEEKKAYIRRAVSYLNEKYGEGSFVLTLKDSYYNMKEKIEPDHLYLIDLARSAMEEAGVKPEVVPIRGGTDGARLSYMGLPCPNLCTGGENFHGKYEFISIQSMEKVTDILIQIVKGFEKY